jgi:hypothetical protein
MEVGMPELVVIERRLSFTASLNRSGTIGRIING